MTSKLTTYQLLKPIGLMMLMWIVIMFLVANTVNAASQACGTSYGPPPNDYCMCGGNTCASNVCPAAPGTCVGGTYGTLAGICGPEIDNDPYSPTFGQTIYKGTWCEQWTGCCVPGGPGPTVTPGPGCTQSGWTNVGCGAGGCAANQMYQTRTVNPAGCAATSQCLSGYPACTGVPSSCDFSVNNLVLNGTGDSATAQLYGITLVGSTVNDVTFTTFNPAIVTSTSPDSVAPYSSLVTATGVGNTSVLVRMTMNNAVFCQKSFDVVVNNPSGWCQAGLGDIIAGTGNVASSIPTVCTDPVTCVLIAGTTSRSPGVALAGGVVSPGAGETSQPEPPYNWLVSNSPYGGTDYNYAFFDSRSQAITFVNPPNSTLSNGVADLAGYKWLKSSSDFTIPADIDLTTNKVILLVNGDLNINGKINLTDGIGYFMAVVNGDINVKGSVGGASDGSPELEGLYFADQTFHSAVIDAAPHQQLHVKGSVVADAFDLTRSLADNSSTPAELFEFSPALLMQVPVSFGSRQIIWREVAP